MAVQTTTFKGARYLVKFPGEWTNDNSYEALEAVQYNGYTYISKQPVPVGVDISNTDFWLLWADPNAQMEELTQTVSNYADAVTDLGNTVSGMESEISELDNAINSASIVTAPLDSVEKLGNVPNASNHTFQGGCVYGDYIYIAHYLNTSNNTIISKYLLADLSEVDSVTLDMPHHANSVNVNPATGYLLVSGTTTTTNNYMYVINPDSMEIVKKVRYMQVNGFCVNSSGNWAIANMTGSNAYGVYKLTDGAYVFQGVTDEYVSGFSGRQMTNQFQTGYCRLESKAQTTAKNSIVLMTATGQYKFTLQFPNLNVEFESLTYNGDKTFYLTDAEGGVYLLDASEPLAYIGEFNELSTTGIKKGSQYISPSIATDLELGTDVKSTLGNYYFKVRPYVPTICRRNFGTDIHGFISPCVQRAIVSANATITTMLVSGMGLINHIPVYIEIRYAQISSTHLYMSNIYALFLNNGNHYQVTFPAGTTDEDYITAIDNFMETVNTAESVYPFVTSTISNGYYSVGDTSIFNNSSTDYSEYPELSYGMNVLLS